MGLKISDVLGMFHVKQHSFQRGDTIFNVLPALQQAPPPRVNRQSFACMMTVETLYVAWMPGVD